MRRSSSSCATSPAIRAKSNIVGPSCPSSTTVVGFLVFPLARNGPACTSDPGWLCSLCSWRSVPIAYRARAKTLEAKRFYAVIAVAMLLSLLLDFAKVDPIKALVLSAAINGIAAVPILFLLMIMSREIHELWVNFACRLYQTDWAGRPLDL
jgi:hypothetical protein